MGGVSDNNADVGRGQRRKPSRFPASKSLARQTISL
jgi:hypothetical protein